MNKKELYDILGGKKVIVQALKDERISPQDLVRLSESLKIKHWGGFRSSSGALRYMRKLEERIGLHDNVGYFADYMGALTRNRIGWGHSKSYLEEFSIKYGITENQTTEVFANYIELTNSAGGAAWKKILQRQTPNITEKFDDMIDELDKIARGVYG